MRRAIRVLKTPVTLIVLLAILGYGAVWGYQHATMDTTVARATEPCVPTDVGPELTPPRVTVRVFNAGTRSKAASLTRLYLNGYGFRVTLVNNSDRNIESTVVIGNSADDPEVKLVQQFFAGSVAEGDGRADHVVDVLIFDKTQQVEKPATSVPVEGPVCLPAIKGHASPSGSPSPSASPTR